KDREIQIFNLDVDLVERLVKDGSYIEQLIPKHTYRRDKGTLTVGVRALLLTSRDAGDPAITKLADALFKNPEAIENELQGRVKAEQRIHKDPVTGDPSKLGLVRLDPPGALLERQLHHHKYSHPWLKKLVPWLALGLLVVFVLYRFRRVIGPQF